jgi:hypothetical protein
MADAPLAQAFSVDCSTCSARAPDAIPGSIERVTQAPTVGHVRQDCRTLTNTSATEVALCTSSATRLPGADTVVRRTVTATPVTPALMLATPTPGAELTRFDVAGMLDTTTSLDSTITVTFRRAVAVDATPTPPTNEPAAPCTAVDPPEIAERSTITSMNCAKLAP